MRFTPKSEQELEQERQERMKLLREGRGTFSVINGETKEKDDPEMGRIEYHLLTLDVWDADGEQRQLSNVCLHPKMVQFVRQFCYATGLESEYETGSLTLDDCLGKSGECEIGIEKGGLDGRGGKYPDKNRVKAFVVAKAAPRQAPAANGVATAAAQQAGRDAFAAYKAKFPGDAVQQVKNYKAAFVAYFGNRESSAVRADEWKRFAADGFVKAAAGDSFATEQQFKDDDIPF